jgi:hypothetical protein
VVEMLVDGSRKSSHGGSVSPHVTKKLVKRGSKTRAMVPRSKKPDRAIQKRRAKVNEELDRIYEQHGMLTKVLLVDTARDPKHPLHRYFEWDDTVAGERWRQEQALQMIRASKYVELLNDARANQVSQVVSHVEVRTYLRGRQEKGPAEFKMRNVVLSDADDHAATVEQFRSELRAWCMRVVGIAELQVLRRLIEGELDRS